MSSLQFRLSPMEASSSTYGSPFTPNSRTTTRFDSTTLPPAASVALACSIRYQPLQLWHSGICTSSSHSFAAPADEGLELHLTSYATPPTTARITYAHHMKLCHHRLPSHQLRLPLDAVSAYFCSTVGMTM
jgi:hypothetical protein